jgi:branched-chain amino acid transport system substrate-binding protein
MLTDQGRANVFRTIGRDDMQGRAAGDYLAEHWADRKIAILNDGTTYGKGLADETKRQLNKRGVDEAIFGTYEPGRDDYSDEVAALQAADVAALYVGGYPNDIGLIARVAHDRGYPVQLVSADTIATEEFSLVAGPAADGALFTFVADPRNKPEAAQVVERFRAENIEPDSVTLLSYAAVQAWAQAVEKAGTIEPTAVITSLHENQFDTVLGRIDFDDKGDLRDQSWVWYVWQGGEYRPLGR